MNKSVNPIAKKNKNEEKEIKVQISKKQYDKLLSNQLYQLKLIEKINQKDIYYDKEDMYITNLNRGLRVRFKGDSPHCLEFKSLFCNPYAQNNNPWFIEEITLPFPLKLNSLNDFFSILVRLNLLSPITSTYYSSSLSHFPQVEQVLLNSQLKPMITVRKNRVGYQDDQAEYFLDYIENLGYFLEIESQQDNPLDILEKLSLKEYQLIRNGYNDMLAVTVPAYLPNETKQEKFREDPMWNVLPSEKDLIEKIFSPR